MRMPEIKEKFENGAPLIRRNFIHKSTCTIGEEGITYGQLLKVLEEYKGEYNVKQEGVGVIKHIYTYIKS